MNYKYIIFILDEKSFYTGTIVNRALPSLHGGSHVITFTVPFIVIMLTTDTENLYLHFPEI